MIGIDRYGKHRAVIIAHLPPHRPGVTGSDRDGVMVDIGDVLGVAMTNHKSSVKRIGSTECRYRWRSAL